MLLCTHPLTLFKFSRPLPRFLAINLTYDSLSRRPTVLEDPVTSLVVTLLPCACLLKKSSILFLLFSSSASAMVEVHNCEHSNDEWEWHKSKYDTMKKKKLPLAEQRRVRNNDGHSSAKNPATGTPYVPQESRRIQRRAKRWRIGDRGEVCWNQC